MNILSTIKIKGPLLWEQRVVGSNPAAPILKTQSYQGFPRFPFSRRSFLFSTVFHKSRHEKVRAFGRIRNIFLILLLASSIAHGEEFDSYLKGFREAYSKYALPNFNHRSELSIEGIQVLFGEVSNKEAIAQCHQGNHAPFILIHRQKFENLSPIGREAVLFHEVAHCVLNREHKSTFIVIEGETIPSSLMYPRHLPDSLYSRFRDYYLQELFMPQ